MRNRVVALPGHYERIVSAATMGGMITWSDVASESESTRRRHDAITITSFAVRKDEASDRLISWSKSQNYFMIAPDDVYLPDPGMLDRLSYSENLNLCGIGTDISNMFHNICLPAWLLPFFPLRKVRFGILFGEAQRRLCSELQLRKRLQQSATFRPMQRTLAMGFKWAMAVTHILTTNLIARVASALSTTFR